jgi:DNA polymerase III subunit delta
MLLFLYGEDTYRSKKKLEEIVEGYKKIRKSGLNLIWLDTVDLEFKVFFESIRQVSMFKEIKLIVLSNFSANQDFKDKFIKNFEIFSKTKDIIIFYQAGKISLKDKFSLFLKKKAKSQEFNILKGQKLNNWIKAEFSKFEIKASQIAINRLIDLVGSDLWLASNEIKKLACYRKREGKIELKDVEEMVSSDAVENSVFKMVDAISAKNKKQALRLLHSHLDKGDNPSLLLSTINFQFKNLLGLKELMEKRISPHLVSKIAGLHPFVLRKSYQQVSNFTLPELKKICWEIFQTDLNIKTGKIKPETALDLFITKL